MFFAGDNQGDRADVCVHFLADGVHVKELSIHL